MKQILYIYVIIMSLSSCTATSSLNKEFIYQVELRDSLNTLISRENVLLLLDTMPWGFDQSQFRATYSFDTSSVVPKELGIGFFCEGDKKSELIRESTSETGYELSDSLFWIHPIRSNQYRYTEVAPFPYIKLNVEVGNTWDLSKVIGEEWCELAGETSESYILKSKNKRINGVRCYWVSATSKHPFGESSVDFYFNKNKGLIFTEYILSRGYKLSIILIK